MLYFNNVFTFSEFADKYSAIPNFSLVNELDLTRILKAEIFAHTDGQLRAAHIILGYDPISSSFQAPKYVIKVKDPPLHQINITISSFLAGSTPKGTQLVELPFQRTAEEEATLSQPIPKETANVVEVSDSKEEFEVFNQLQSPKPSDVDVSHLPSAQVSNVQEAPSIPNAMVLQHKAKTSFLDLLESHVGGTMLEVAIQTKPLTPFPA